MSETTQALPDAVAGQVDQGVRPDGDLALLMLAQQAELDAGPPYLMSMLKGDTVVGDFQGRLALLMRAAVAAERERCAGGHDLEAMCEAFNRLIEAHANLRSPFHQPVCADAQMALRVLRGVVSALRA